MRILPYREPDSTVTGERVTFIDVTSIVPVEEALVAADGRPAGWFFDQHLTSRLIRKN